MDGKEGIRVVLTGGGSAGHVYPALTIGKLIKKRFPRAEFLFIGTSDGAEAQIAPQAGMPIEFIPMDGFKLSASAFGNSGIKLIRSFLQCISILERFRPTLIVSTGGYVSVPVVFAGAVLRGFYRKSVKIVIHEQNATPGVANRVCSFFADKVMTTTVSSYDYFPSGKVVCSGYPLREEFTREISEGLRNEMRRRFGIGPKDFVVLVFGGSAGSRTINRAIVDALPVIFHRDESIHVIHLVGKYRSSDYDPVGDTDARLKKKELTSYLMKRYHRYVYSDELWSLFGISDLVVSRAGAGTTNEIISLKKPSILIPKMDSTSLHQYTNAMMMHRMGLCSILIERPCGEGGVMAVDGGELARQILSIKRHRGMVQSMKSNIERYISTGRKLPIDSIVAEVIRSG